MAERIVSKERSITFYNERGELIGSVDDVKGVRITNNWLVKNSTEGSVRAIISEYESKWSDYWHMFSKYHGSTNFYLRGGAWVKGEVYPLKKRHH